MGADKAALLLGGLSLLERVHERVAPVCERVVVVGGPPRLAHRGVVTIGDRFPGADALGGVATALEHARATLGPEAPVLCVAADMPFLVPELLFHLRRRLGNCDLVVPRVVAGYEPLCAIYRATCLAAFVEAIRTGNLRLRSAFASLRVREVAEEELRRVDPDLRSFLNLNRPEDVVSARRLIDGQG